MSLNSHSVNDEIVGFILDYINEVINKPDFNLFNEQYICDILQLLKTDRLDRVLAGNIEMLLDSCLNISAINPADEIEYIYHFMDEHNSSMDETEFDELLRTYAIFKVIQL